MIVEITNKKNILFVFFCLILNFPSFSQFSWDKKELIKGGRIDAISDLGDGIVVAGSRSYFMEQENSLGPGSVFRSSDYGLTWTNIGSIIDEPLRQIENGILCIMAGRKDFDFLLTTNGEIWRSSDSGLTWNQVNKLCGKKEEYTFSYSICITQSGTVLATCGTSIYRSIDNGENFEEVGPISRNLLYRLQLTSVGVFVNGWDGELYRSIDDGQNWQFYAKIGPATNPFDPEKTLLKTQPFLTAIEYLGGQEIIQGTMAGENYIIDQYNSRRIMKMTNISTGSLDDYVFLGYKTILSSTFTSDKNIYISYDRGDTWENSGTIGTLSGDWLDHVVRLDKPDSVVVIGGTRMGYIVRTAFSRRDLYNRAYPDHNTSQEDESFLENAIKGVITDFIELDEPEDILIDGNYAYIPCRGGNNLTVIDISNPKDLKVINVFRDEELKEAMGVAKNESYIYLTSMSNEKCIVIDAGNPYKLEKIFSFRVGGVNQFNNTLRKVSYSEGYLYFTHDGEGAVYIADARDPEKPKIISRLGDNDGAFALAVENDIVYVGGCIGSSSFKIIDVSDKKNPKLIQKLISADKYNCLSNFVLRNGVLHSVAWLSNSYIQFDISDPYNVKEIEFFQSNELDGPNRLILTDNNEVFTINSKGNSISHLNIESNVSIVKTISSPHFEKGYGINYKDGILYIVGRDSKKLIALDASAFK